MRTWERTSGMTDRTRRQELYANSQRNRKVALASYRMGWPLDTAKHAEIASEIDDKIATLDAALAAELGELADAEEDADLGARVRGLNANSPPQIAWLFYEYLEEPIRLRTDSGAPSGGKAALEGIVRTGSPGAARIATILKDRKKFAKLREAYISNLAGVSLVRPAAHVTAQVGGRWSYRDPALQTVPQAIKPMFTAHPGCWMVACDLAGAELRSMALQAGCAPMLDAFNNGRDLHRNTASVLFGVSEEEVQPAQRKIAKGVGLGFHYSVLDFEGAAAGLYAQVGHLAKGLSFEMILGAIKRLAAARPEIMRFKEQTWERAQRLDYVEEPLLRRRRYFHGKPKDTESYNFAQQAMIAAIVDRAVQGIDAEFRGGEGLHLQRHDELIIGGPDLPRLCTLLWKHMRQTYTIGGNTLCFEVEFTVTRRWGEGVDIVPVDLGRAFKAECRCGWGADGVDLEKIAGQTGAHYDNCPKMEGYKA